MMNVSGMKVYPTKSEVALMHPGVAEAGAIGVPDPLSGEAVRVVIVARDPSLTAADVIAHCRNYLAGFGRRVNSRFRCQSRKKPLWARSCAALCGERPEEAADRTGL